MNRLSDDDLEGMNDMLATAARDGAKLGVMSAESLYQLCCEVQAWRRERPFSFYNTVTHKICDDSPKGLQA